MASKTLGRSFRVRKKQKETGRQKNHRWESNAIKIAKLHSLDPLRKVRRHDLDPDADDLSATTSYLRNGVERWTDINITQNYVEFKRAVLPLCDSLPQILHHADQIMALLGAHIEAADRESLEPLLDLMTAFARDLGQRFEKYYGRALELVRETIFRGGSTDAEVIAWANTTLVFLYKYLGKLLAPNVRPTYDAISPLLGKRRLQPQAVRLAAEGFSFLVKKVTSPSHRASALKEIVAYIRKDVETFEDTRQANLFHHGVMAVFAEAMKGAGTSLHSTAPYMLTALLDSDQERQTQVWRDIVSGVFVAAVRHADPSSLHPLLQTIYGRLGDDSRPTSASELAFLLRLLTLVASFRHGHKVKKWELLAEASTSLIEAIYKLLEIAFSESQDLEGAQRACGIDIWGEVLARAAILWSSGPFSAFIPHVPSLQSLVSQGLLEGYYAPFIVYLAELDGELRKSLFSARDMNK